MEFEDKAKIVASFLCLVIVVFLAGVVLSYADTRGLLHFAKSDTDKPIHKVGETDVFNVYDFETEKSVDIAAECRRVGPHSYLLVEERLAVDGETIEYLGQGFDEDIYPGSSDIFSGELSAGINADNRVIILLLNKNRAFPWKLRHEVVRGFYSHTNERPRALAPESNEAKIIHIFVNPLSYSEEDLFETIAHEARHLKNYSVMKNNMGLTFTGLFFVATLFLMYLGLSHLYYAFISVKRTSNLGRPA